MVTPTRGRPRSFDRDAALDKAVRLFWRRGYEATSIRDLTEELGIGAPSLYSAFGDKQQLFTEVLRVYEAEYGGFIDEALAEESTARQAAARIFAQAPGRYTRRGLPAGCLIVSGDAGTTEATVQDALRRIRRRNVAEFVDKISVDVERGTLPAETDAPALAQYTMAMLNGIAQAASDRVPRSLLEQAARIALQAWP
jgi:AcrR family transcriptional regulator